MEQLQKQAHVRYYYDYMSYNTTFYSIITSSYITRIAAAPQKDFYISVVRNIFELQKMIFYAKVKNNQV